jgi:hypothetical protein
MVRTWTLATVALVVAAMVGPPTAGVGRAETVLNTDFAQGSAGWVLHLDGQLLNVGGRQVLSLTQEMNNQGVAWTETKRGVPSFSFIADIRIRHDAEGCPANGVLLTYADAPSSAIGGGGSQMGVFNNPDEIGRFIALDINTYHGQGLGSGDCTEATAIPETIALDNMKPGCPGCQDDPETGRRGYDRHTGQNNPGDPAKGGIKLGQVGFPTGLKIVNGGTWRYHWNVDGATDTVTAYMTGLDESNKQFQKVKVLEVKSGIPVLDFEGRWGFGSATATANQHTEVLAARIEAPAIAP